MRRLALSAPALPYPVEVVSCPLLHTCAHCNSRVARASGLERVLGLCQTESENLKFKQVQLDTHLQ